MDLSAYSVWESLVQIGVIFLAILIANAIRRKVKFVKNTLLPSSVIAGLLIFILKFFKFTDSFIDSDFMEVITYHALGLGFVALSLKSSVKKKDKNKLVVLDTGITTVNSYLIQAIFGLGLSILLSVTIFKDLFHAAGLLLPMGFGQGTGQALNIGNVFETFGFTNGSTFGLSKVLSAILFSCSTNFPVFLK